MCYYFSIKNLGNGLLLFPIFLFFGGVFMLLSVKKRQTYLKELGFYDGAVDGKAGAKTKAAYKALQDKHFKRESDRDGIYGSNTDILLRNAYNVKKYTKNFDLDEFECQCKGRYCTGYPATLSVNLLKNLQAVRDKFGSTTITSGLRCKRHNINEGGASKSKHMYGKACDIRNSTSRSLAGRRKIMNFWKTLKYWNYTYCNENGNYPNMGTAVHVDVYK